MKTGFSSICSILVLVLLATIPAQAQISDSLLKNLKFTIGAELGASVCFQDQAKSMNNTLRKRNAFADPYAGINLRLSYKNAFIESGWFKHQIRMSYMIVDEEMNRSIQSISFSDADVFTEIPIRIGWQFSFRKKAERGFFIAPSIGIATIQTKPAGLNMSGISIGHGAGTSFAQEYAFYRLNEKQVAFSSAMQCGYTFKKLSLSLQNSFTFNPKNWFSGEVHYLRNSQQKGALQDQGFLSWKTKIWSASFCVRYSLW